MALQDAVESAMAMETERRSRDCDSFTEEKSGPGYHRGECLHEKRNSVSRDDEPTRFLPIYQPDNPTQCRFFSPNKKRPACVQTTLDF